MKPKDIMKQRRETLSLTRRDFFGLLTAMAGKEFIGAVNIRKPTATPI
ncbi:MAG: hypothetical protein NC114_01840 [Ruminococcus flavefaciens]|nr:hypothetical protein [Ruminococcus flavefaciens]